LSPKWDVEKQKALYLPGMLLASTINKRLWIKQDFLAVQVDQAVQALVILFQDQPGLGGRAHFVRHGGAE